MAASPGKVALAKRVAAVSALFLAISQSGTATPRAHTASSNPVRGPRFGAAATAPRPARQFGAEEDYQLRATFDRDKDGRLNEAERRAAREHAESMGLGRGRSGRGWYPAAPAQGRLLEPKDVESFPAAGLFDVDVVRTLFFTFENADWERELMAFKTTDIDVPATLVTDGRTYTDVGIQFHGNSSFSGVPLGYKHSMRVAMDFVDGSQDLKGFSTLLLLNAHEDPSFVRTVLAMQVAREYYPAPRANFVRVVINGESWGLFINQQQFNKDMTRDLFKTTDGARWKVNGTRAERGGGLPYLGEDERAYRYAYEIRSKDEPASWRSLITLTRLLERTPATALEQAIAPHLDVDAALRFLAVENALVNTDGYWTKGSDYNLFMAPDGRFRLLPYDVNGTFATGSGPAGSRTGSVWLDPLYAAGDPSKALAARLLAVPALRQRYLGYVEEIARVWLDWRRLGPIVERYQAQIDADVRADTRKLTSYEAFVASSDELRSFAAARRDFLLEALGASRQATSQVTTQK